MVEQSLSEPAVGTAIAPVALVLVIDPLPRRQASDRVVLLSGVATASSTPPRPG